MRFLQTEWHRHERDRNAWEIERQEMKGRIARLEGSTRKADYSNKSLKRYVDMLERALRERDAKLRAGVTSTESSMDDKDIKTSKKDRLRRTYDSNFEKFFWLTRYSDAREAS